MNLGWYTFFNSSLQWRYNLNEPNFCRTRTLNSIILFFIHQVERVIVGHDARGPGVGWYLDEINVNVPSRDDEIVFSCHCWLAEDKDDGRLERELSSTLGNSSVERGAGGLGG